ncbi:MAG: class I SAM-dependent methyltransferase [Bacteroidota bacterium]
MKDEGNARFYDSDSREYDAKRWQSKAGWYNNERQQQIVSELTESWHSLRLIEVGPGTARFTIPLARKGNRLTIIDVSAAMIEKAQTRIAEEGLAASIEQAICASVYELPVKDGQFDCAVCLNVISHLERPAAALQEFGRVLRPGGLLLFNYPNLHSFYRPYARKVNASARAVSENVYSVWQRPADVKRWLKNAGLELMTQRGHAHVPRALDRHGVLGVIKLLDGISSRFPLQRFAPVHFCLCRKL